MVSATLTDIVSCDTNYPIVRLDAHIRHREYHCHGVLTGFSRKKLELEERAAIDRAITKFIKNVRQSIQTGSNWKVSIVWQNKPQPHY